MSFFDVDNIISEVRRNKQYKVKVLVALWRLAQLRQRSLVFSLLFFPVHLLYWVYSQLLLGVELPVAVECQGPLIIWHGNGIVVNPAVKLGSCVVLRNGVTIGNDGYSSGCPVIGDNVEIGANSVLIGAISIARRAKIGPTSFVNFDVAEGEKIISGTLKK